MDKSSQYSSSLLSQKPTLKTKQEKETKDYDKKSICKLEEICGKQNSSIDVKDFKGSGFALEKFKIC